MIENTKLSLWDFFVSALSGFAIALNVVAHFVFTRFVTWEDVSDLPSAFLVVLGLLTIILAGLLFEPLSNYVSKCLTTCPANWSQMLSFKKWDVSICALEEAAREYVPEGAKEQTYQYCKNWLHHNSTTDTYMPFLAKYGFYRGMFLLLLLNCIAVWFIYPRSCNTCALSVFLFALALVYLHRSGDFYRHMSTTVYSQFIACFNENTSRT